MPVAERRRALVDATLALVVREGVAGASARAIVSAAGMPLGALHYAFDSVDALLDAAADAVTDQERLALEPVVARVPGAPLETMLADGLAGYVDLLRDQPGRELAFLELTLHAARRRLDAPAAPGSYARSYGVVEALLEEAASSAGRRWTTPVATLARQTVVVLDGITTTWLADHDDTAAHECARFHAAVLAAHAQPLEEDGHAH